MIDDGKRTSGPADSTRIGYLLGPHGVAGAIKLFVLGDAVQLVSLRRVYVEQRGWLNIRRIEGLAPGLVLHLAGVDSREAAEALRGLGVYAADSELPDLEEGSYYYHDLRGLDIVDTAGQKLGQVKDVLDSGHQDVLVVAVNAQEFLIPLQAPYVVVDTHQGKPTLLHLTNEAPEGLLDE